MAYNNVVNNGIIKINGGSIFSFGIPGKPSPTSDILHGNSFRKSYLFTETEKKRIHENPPSTNIGRNEF